MLKTFQGKHMKYRPFLLMTGLVTSFSTLLCCALPMILVSLGLGSVMAALLSNLPWLIWLSEHAIYLFIFTLIILLMSGYMIFWQQTFCEVDPNNIKQCKVKNRYAKLVWFLTLTIFIIGFIFKYVLIYFS